MIALYAGSVSAPVYSTHFVLDFVFIVWGLFWWAPGLWQSWRKQGRGNAWFSRSGIFDVQAQE